MTYGSRPIQTTLLALIASGTIFELADSQRFGNFYVPSDTSVPEATAFFPLTASASSGTDIASHAGQFTQYGSINGTERWVADSLFGYVLKCSREDYNSIVLNPVTIGQTGPFAVNLWFKSNATDNPGGTFAYLLSAFENASLSSPPTGDSWVYETNSLQMMLPQANHNRSGIMRTVVKDSNDVNVSSTLDSDNQYNAEAAWPANANFLNVSNGGWHMATVTTNVNSAHGFLVYMDGQLAGRIPPEEAPNVQTPAILGGTNYSIDGGDPMYLRGNIFLCSRADGRSDRFFSGSVAQLSLYNEALNATSIEALYDAVTAQAAFSSAPLAAPMPAPGTQATSEGTTASPAGTTASPAATTASPVATTASPSAATASPAADAASSSPAVTDPRASTVPDVSPVTATATDSSPTAGNTQSHTLSKGAIAGAVIGAVAGAVLIGAAAAFAVMKLRKPAGHRRLQEAPSAKFLMHTNSMEKATPTFSKGEDRLFKAEGADKYRINAIP